jgi:hypothetical protein
MLFGCGGRFGKIEIEKCEKEGEYTLTVPFSPDRVIRRRIIVSSCRRPTTFTFGLSTAMTPTGSAACRTARQVAYLVAGTQRNVAFVEITGRTVQIASAYQPPRLFAGRSDHPDLQAPPPTCVHAEGSQVQQRSNVSA